MAGNNSGFQPPPRVKNALDNRKLNLSSPCPTNPGKKSNLIWGLYEGNPRLTVYIGDNEGSKVSAALDLPVFQAFLALLESAPSKEPGWKNCIENKNFTWYGGKRSEAAEVVSELWVGKDKEGQIWISVTDKKAPKVQFFFSEPEFHHFKHGDGTSFTKAETSELFAKGYISILNSVVNSLFVTSWPEVEAANKRRAEAAAEKRGGGSGGYGGGGGGYTNRAPAPPAAIVTGDDFPF
jgi:hypothetical protein